MINHTYTQYTLLVLKSQEQLKTLISLEIRLTIYILFLLSGIIFFFIFVM